MLSPVRPSVTHRYIIQKQLKLGSWNFHLCGVSKFHLEIQTGSTRTGASNKGGVGENSYFLALNVNISKTVGDAAKVTLND